MTPPPRPPGPCSEQRPTETSRPPARALRDKADVEARNDRRQTPLVVATKAEQTSVAILLLDAGADPDAKDELSDSAFLYAGAEGYDDILRPL